MVKNNTVPRPKQQHYSSFFESPKVGIIVIFVLFSIQIIYEQLPIK